MQVTIDLKIRKVIPVPVLPNTPKELRAMTVKELENNICIIVIDGDVTLFNGSKFGASMAARGYNQETFDEKKNIVYVLDTEYGKSVYEVFVLNHCHYLTTDPSDVELTREKYASEPADNKWMKTHSVIDGQNYCAEPHFAFL